MPGRITPPDAAVLRPKQGSAAGGTAPDATIRPATVADLRYVDALQRKFSNQVGWLPRAALEWLIERGQITVALENGEPAGYVAGRALYKTRPELRPVTQTAVQYDAQRLSHGRQLIQHLAETARAAGQIGLQACCREDLEANKFFIAAGFKPITILTPPNRRRQNVIVWRLPLTNRLPLWFANPPKRAGYRAGTAQSLRDTEKNYEQLIARIFPHHPTERPTPTEKTSPPAT